jgi:UDP-N-acetylglucosamine enolpyruvyl transferase
VEEGREGKEAEGEEVGEEGEEDNERRTSGFFPEASSIKASRASWWIAGPTLCRHKRSPISTSAGAQTQQRPF